MIRRRMRRRGQATVELAVLCIVLVPLIMYVIFLDDLLRYKLDAAEGVFSAPWDYTSLDYEKGFDPTVVQRQIRRGLCDHTVAYNSYNTDYDCKEGNHHKALAAHACWVTKPGGQQVTCTIANASMGQDPFSGSNTGEVKSFNKGGQLRCTARLGVINYFLPAKVLEQFSQEDMTRTAKKTGNDIHGDAAKLGSVQNYYLLERQFMSVLTDTWAMTTVEAVDRNSNGGVLYGRVVKVYPKKYADKAKKFGDDAVQKKMLMRTAVMDARALGDDPTTPQVSFSTARPPQVMDFFVSPWKDKSGDKVEGTDSKRGNFYFGWDKAPE